MSIQCGHCSFIIIEDKLAKYWFSTPRAINWWYFIYGDFNLRR